MAFFFFWKITAIGGSRCDPRPCYGVVMGNRNIVSSGNGAMDDQKQHRPEREPLIEEGRFTSKSAPSDAQYPLPLGEEKTAGDDDDADTGVNINTDVLLANAGGFGRFQWVYLAITCLSYGSDGMIIVSSNLTGRSVDPSCAAGGEVLDQIS